MLQGRGPRTGLSSTTGWAAGLVSLERAFSPQKMCTGQQSL